jgi:hypothetical protein
LCLKEVREGRITKSEIEPIREKTEKEIEKTKKEIGMKRNILLFGNSLTYRVNI